jgi:Protein of unknown function (DUF2950)
VTLARELFRRLSGRRILAALSLWLLLVPSTGRPQTGNQTRFNTPDAAAQALLGALRDNDTPALVKILGPTFAEHVSSDTAESRENRRRIYDLAQDKLSLQQEGEDRVVLVLGGQEWSFPIALVKTGGKWHFDTEEGIEEILDRIIGENELTGIEAFRAYGNAQRQYAARDRDGDQVREFAQRLGSSPGQQDGLYWDEAAFGGEVSPFGPLLADADEYLKQAGPGAPYQGYRYRILTRQGSNVPGGRYDYVINGNMIAGFALLAFPADYGKTGIMTFVVSHQGKIYQKDLGEETVEIGTAMQEYDPDSTWTEVE